MTTRKLKNKNPSTVSKVSKDAQIAKDHRQAKSSSRSKELVENMSTRNDETGLTQDLRGFLHFINEKKSF